MKTRSLSYWINLPRERFKLFSHITHESKNIFNQFLFCSKIFHKYKYDIYYLASLFHPSDINQFILNELNIKYVFHQHILPNLKNNNTIVYSFIKTLNPIVYDYNFDELYNSILLQCSNLNGIIYSDATKHVLLDDVVKSILKSRYFANFYRSKFEMLNHIPLTITDEKFIKHVRSGNMLFKNISYKPQLDKLYKNIFSDQYLLRTFVLNNLLYCSLPNEIIINILDKCYCMLESNIKLRGKGLKVGDIKYLSKDSHFNVIFYKNSIKIDNDTIRLSLGKKIATSYNTITNSNYNILRQTKNKTFYEGNNGIFEGNYHFINIPQYLKDKENIKIKMVEICPIYDGYNYKVCMTYEEDINDEIKETASINDMISIDIGEKNLLTIHDPKSKQYLVRGSLITTPIEYYNKQLDTMQSQLPKNKHSSNKIRDTLIKCNNIVTDKLNKLVSVLYDKYKHKKVIIIGYNEDWKQNINIGHKNNRIFCQIPFTKIIQKIKDKFINTKVETIPEPYTSKCDALNLEPVCKRKEYDGERIKRGLFESKTAQIINADLNGSINIMRLYCKKKNIKFDSVKGIQLMNPKRIEL